MSDIAAVTASSVPSQADTPAPSKGLAMWSHGSFSFKDLVDIVNPLQHIPVIGSIYRYLTGDEPSTGTRIIGDGLYGGPIGFGVSVVVQAVTSLLPGADGRDLGEKALASVFGDRNHSPALAAAPANTSSQTAQTQTPPITQIPATAAPILLAQAFQGQPGQAQILNSPQLAASLYRSPAVQPAAAAPDPSPNARSLPLQRQLGDTRSANGQTLNSRAIPLELSSNLLPAAHPASAARSVMPPQLPPPNATASNNAGTPNAIAQKMLDALDKYERLKKQQSQGDNERGGDQPRVDLSL
jgi:hypothetical protein